MLINIFMIYKGSEFYPVDRKVINLASQSYLNNRGEQHKLLVAQPHHPLFSVGTVNQ